MRSVARVLVISNENRLFLLKAADPITDRRFWMTPGGGLEGGESFEAAARRELFEETGFSLALGPCVWTRRHMFEWRRKRIDQYERFFVAPGAEGAEPAPMDQDRHVVGHRWWSLDEILASTALFSPRWLGDLLPAILRGEYPEFPIDCGDSVQST